MHLDSITDFLSAILTAIAAIIGIGIFGKTYDDKKKTVKPMGYVFILISIMSVATAIWTIKKKDEEISRRKEIGEYAKAQIRKELRGLMTPLLFDPHDPYDIPDPAETPTIDFDGYVKDSAYLRTVFAQPVFNSSKFESRDTTIFVRDSLAIQNNQDLLNQTIAKYSSYLDGEILRSVDEIFSDDFYNRYSLRGFGRAFDIAFKCKNERIKSKKRYSKIDQEKLKNKSSSFGNYYYSISSEHEKKPFQGLSGLIAKFEKLYNEVSE